MIIWLYKNKNSQIVFKKIRHRDILLNAGREI